MLVSEGEEGTEITIVPLQEVHLDALAELERSCFAEPWTRAQLQEECVNPMAHVFVALLDGQVAGYAGMHCILDEAYVNNVAVFPMFRRCGIAKKLVCAMSDCCITLRMAFLTLEVRASNLAAISLYQQAGFAPVGTRRHFYTHPTEDAILMTRFF